MPRDLKSWMSAHGVAKNYLAKATGLHWITIDKAVERKGETSIDTALRIEKAIGAAVKAEDILGLDEKRGALSDD